MNIFQMKANKRAVLVHSTPRKAKAVYPNDWIEKFD